MEKHVGTEFDGVVSGVTSFGLFIELVGRRVTGLVHVTQLPNDYYHFDRAPAVAQRRAARPALPPRRHGARAGAARQPRGSQDRLPPGRAAARGARLARRRRAGRSRRTTARRRAAARRSGENAPMKRSDLLVGINAVEAALRHDAGSVIEVLVEAGAHNRASRRFPRPRARRRRVHARPREFLDKAYRRRPPPGRHRALDAAGRTAESDLAGWSRPPDARRWC